MNRSPVEPRPCTDTNCRGQHARDERIALAASLCRERGAQITKLRQQILEMLWESGRPTGAYELIETLRADDAHPIGPPTVYRALEFLRAQGLVSKVESRNAYVPCTHPERRHDCLFFICNGCGSSSEMEDPPLEQLLEENARVLGYRVNRRVVEVEGTCADCAVDGTDLTPV